MKGEESDSYIGTTPSGGRGEMTVGGSIYFFNALFVSWLHSFVDMSASKSLKISRNVDAMYDVGCVRLRLWMIIAI